MASRFAVVTAAIFFITACDGRSPVAPGPVPSGPTQSPTAGLRIVATPVVELSPGETRALQVEERDASGAVVTQPLTAHVWSSSAPETVAVGADGTLRAFTDLGGAAITARSPSGLSATVHVWVQLPSDVPPTYRITLLFSPDVPTGWRTDFENAARAVEQVIRAPLPGFLLDSLPRNACAAPVGEPAMPSLSGIETGTIVYVGRRPGDGATTGGPCIQRPLPRPTVVVGLISIPRPLDDPGRPGFRLALHELGHALGLVGISSVVPSPWFDSMTRRHSGPFALEGYRRLTGQTVPFLQLGPLAHWQFGGDVMSTVSPTVTLAPPSVGALMDMGYPAAWYAAR